MNKIIELLEDVIEDAIIYGNDGEDNTEDLQTSIDNFLECLKESSINKDLEYHTISYNNYVYIAPNFINCRNINTFEDYVFCGKNYIFDKKNKLLENIPQNIISDSVYDGEFLFVNYNNVDYLIGMDSYNLKTYNDKEFLRKEIEDVYFIEIPLNYLNDLYKEENKEMLEDFMDKNYFDYLIIKK